MKDEDISKLDEISKLTYKKDNIDFPLINSDEYYNLSIRKGTLTKEEINIIRNHAQLSLDMISELPFPKKFKDVLNIACNHHEKLNGTGYPRGLSEKDISLEDRIMILSDIFEALTTSERPYKEAMKLSTVKNILENMIDRGEIDKNLVQFFFNNDILNVYAKEALKPEQFDLIK
jgi:HD-GYP domain-containing protein (c-di-GMP phosphodiesterase class II)